ncbi:F-box/kelch-repeat protein At1g57790-like [Bidens hawaiensis]|uniref:F-box/kelch-repeat protein At1g57790-like n=1 Tax=Bidens hawaiensis TaxID=980011 RepID=UPI0040491D07
MFYDSVCFSAPPTSPNCIVVGLAAVLPMHVFVYFINQESSWRVFRMDFGGTTPDLFRFSTFYGQDVYALYRGALDVFREIEGRPFWDGAVVEAPRGKSAQYFLVSCCQHLLLVVMDELGKSVEVLKLNDSTQEWEKIDSLGAHAIYICGTTCVCMEAKTPEMENKIYFPRLHSKSEKIIFYSLETCRYHTLNGRNIQHCLEDFFGTSYSIYSHAWIEPSWS